MTPVDPADVRFAVCIRNDDHPASLEVRKLYPVLPDSDAAEHGMVRIVDESGEDYLYPADDFCIVTLRHDVEQALLKAS
ncbi:MAG TPA: hypothetical protein VK420_14320 [Longimicrobium sp.]|jgi:hypothetical protein|nr:hypothetical protein [Longimicrobium sp.]